MTHFLKKTWKNKSTSKVGFKSNNMNRVEMSRLQIDSKIENGFISRLQNRSCFYLTHSQLKSASKNIKKNGCHFGVYY